MQPLLLVWYSQTPVFQGLKSNQTFLFINFFHIRFGKAGEQERINVLCILSLNIINDKVFLVLWWWFLIISVLGSIRIIHRFIQCFSAELRYQLINMRMYRHFKRSAKSDKIEMYIKQHCTLGDWFVLYQLSKNLNKPFFMEFLSRLPDSFQTAAAFPPTEATPLNEKFNLQMIENGEKC